MHTHAPDGYLHDGALAEQPGRLRLDRFLALLAALVPHERDILGTVVPEPRRAPARTRAAAAVAASAAAAAAATPTAATMSDLASAVPKLRRSQLSLLRQLYEYACKVPLQPPLGASRTIYTLYMA
jgi:hypothetical protein